MNAFDVSVSLITPSRVVVYCGQNQILMSQEGHLRGMGIINIKRVSVLILPRIKSVHSGVVENNESSPQNVLTGFDLPSSHVH